MMLSPAIIGVVAGATTYLTGMDLARTEKATPPGELHDGIDKARRQSLLEGEIMTGASLLLSKPIARLLPFGIGRFFTPAAVTFAFAAGTAVSVVSHLHEANTHKHNRAYHKLFMSGAIGSSLETAGLTAIGVGLLPFVGGPIKVGLIAAGLGAIALGWPTSLGHGPLAAAIK
ncbi:MAG: hypothetical protein H7123_05225 [Thermoleophilia bacterium]|nr:hypothetical protein [Thermoleophilia bacterium]